MRKIYKGNPDAQEQQKHRGETHTQDTSLWDRLPTRAKLVKRKHWAKSWLNYIFKREMWNCFGEIAWATSLTQECGTHHDQMDRMRHLFSYDCKKPQQTNQQTTFWLWLTWRKEKQKPIATTTKKDAIFRPFCDCEQRKVLKYLDDEKQYKKFRCYIRDYKMNYYHQIHPYTIYTHEVLFVHRKYEKKKELKK